MTGADCVNFNQNAGKGDTVANIDGSTVNSQGDKGIKDDTKTTKMGEEFTNNMDARQKAEAFNLEQKAHGGKEITFDEQGRMLIPDEETAQKFAKSVGGTDLVEKTKQHAVGETLSAIADGLGLDASTVVYGVGATVAAGAGLGLGSKAKSLLKKDKPNNKRDNKDADNIDTKHNMTPEEIKSQSSANLRKGKLLTQSITKKDKIYKLMQKKRKQHYQTLKIKKLVFSQKEKALQKLITK